MFLAFEKLINDSLMDLKCHFFGHYLNQTLL